MAALAAFPISAQQTVTAGIVTRSYRVGDSTVTERVTNARMDLLGRNARLRVDGSAVHYRGAGSTIDGSLPLGVRLDYAIRPGDTVTVFARSASRPGELTENQTTALAIAGTSTVDLESVGLGTTTIGGARLAFSFPVGDLVLAARAGMEAEQRPGGSQPVYWRGTTGRLGVALTAAVGDASVVASIDASRSSADSLGGRNLFPGGGSVTAQLLADVSLPDPFDPLKDARWPIRAAAFYARPFSNSRSDQPNLLIPQGALLGVFAALKVPVKETTLVPSVEVRRESSRSGTTSAFTISTVSGAAWTMSGSLDLTIPLGARFELVPQAGATVGRVGATLANSTGLRRGRLVRTYGFSDGIGGSWMGVQLSATF